MQNVIGSFHQYCLPSSVSVHPQIIKQNQTEYIEITICRTIVHYSDFHKTNNAYIWGESILTYQKLLTCLDFSK